MVKFRGTRSLQKFVSVHASIHNHFNQHRYLISRIDFKKHRDDALVDWRELLVT